MKHNFLSETSKHRILEISDTEIGKMDSTHKTVVIDALTKKVIPDFVPKFNIDDEIEKLMFANKINNLMVRFIRKDKFEDGSDMLVLERLYPIDYNSISKEERINAFGKFYVSIKELHDNGFLHGDIMHPVGRDPLYLFNNIILTKEGLRLIDTGFSVIKENEQIGDYFKKKYQEESEIDTFRQYFIYDI